METKRGYHNKFHMPDLKQNQYFILLTYTLIFWPSFDIMDRYGLVLIHTQVLLGTSSTLTFVCLSRLVFRGRGRITKGSLRWILHLKIVRLVEHIITQRSKRLSEHWVSINYTEQVPGASN
ncbi:hypothetical protein BJX65DRAFT_249408 [Aspergillus insuetus]